jgi:hypothetical protein
VGWVWERGVHFGWREERLGVALAGGVGKTPSEIPRGPRNRASQIRSETRFLTKTVKESGGQETLEGVNLVACGAA